MRCVILAALNTSVASQLPKDLVVPTCFMGSEVRV